MTAQQSYLQTYALDVKALLRTAESFISMDKTSLQKQPAPASWSVAQCIQHLNVYSNHYIPAMEKAVQASASNQAHVVKSGILGAYFIKLMKLDQNKLVSKKMKSPKNAVPQELPDPHAELSIFITHQNHLLDILHRAEKIDINQKRIPTSLSKIVRMRLGDTIAFFIEHEKRHIVQAQRALEK